MAPKPGWTKSVNVDIAFEAGPIQAKLERARAAGCENVELNIGAGASLATDITEADCVNLAKQVQSTGLAISALCLTEPCASGPASPIADDRQRAVEQVIAALDRAAWLGTSVLVLGPGAAGETSGAAPLYDEHCAFALDSLLLLRFEAEARAVHLACRTAAGGFRFSLSEMRDLIDRLNSPWCRVCLDLTTALQDGEAERWILGLGHRLVCVHFSDPALQASSVNGVTVKWRGIASALSEIAYAGSLSYCDRIDGVDEFKNRFDQIASD